MYILPELTPITSTTENRAMAESSTLCGMPETDITGLKETLYAQQQLLQQLYAELDKERESSATAASETLSMILRLQGEKAAVQMEASQYKRLAEEKMSHAENSLSVFEELIYQKEMEIASLEFQVQAHRYKLLSMGCSDLGAYESKFPENLFLQRGDSSNVEMGANGNFRRLKSLPPIQLKDSHHKKLTKERERSMTPMSDLIPEIVKENIDREVNFQNLDLETKSGNSSGGSFDSYWEQITKLDGRVKEISDCKVSGRDKSSMSMPCSLLSQVSGKSSGSTRGESINNLDQIKLHDSIQETEAVVKSFCSSNVQDIFEVPRSNENSKECECQKKERNKLILEGENRLGKPYPVSEESFELHVKDETDWIKKLLCVNHDNKLSKERDGVSVGCNVALVPTIGVDESEVKFQRLCHRIERLEGDRYYTRQEISEVGEEELNLLKEINEKLNLVQTELRSWRTTKKFPPKDEQSLLPITEAMLHFWL